MGRCPHPKMPAKGRGSKETNHERDHSTHSFHNTRINVLVNADNESEAWEEIQLAAYGRQPTEAAKARLRRIRKTLCGMSDCACGTVR